MTTYRQQLSDIMGPCPNCESTVLIISEDEARATLEQCASLEESMPEVLEQILAIDYLCASCFNQAATAAETELRDIKINMKRKKIYGTGLLPLTAKHETLRNSLQDVQARCPDAWAILGACKPEKNLWLYGPPGTGKTYLAHAFANAAIDSGRSAAEISPQTFREITSDWNRSKAKKYTGAYLLILEDIDKVMWTAGEVELLFSILNERYGKNRLLIVTSNSEAEGVQKSIKDASKGNVTMCSAIFDRMLPMERYQILGESLRRTKGDV